MALEAPPPAPIRLPHHPRATAAFAVGLTSLVGVVVLLPVALGPLACYLGASARREIEREPGRWGGQTQATAGLVLGIVATVVLVIVVVLMLAAIGLFSLALHTDTGYGT
jgi:hypothetical protein